MPKTPLKTDIEVMYDKVLIGDGCWEWTGAKIPGGYGFVSRKGKQQVAHRWVYEFLAGPIPAGLTLDHLCRNPSCVNPKHLEAVTLKENLRRAPLQPSTVNASKAVCSQGHEFSHVNVNGQRCCRTCQAATARKRRADKRSSK